MKKEILLHTLCAIALFAAITLLKSWFNISYWPFWAGALIGTILPDIDHILYVYFLRPQELNSQRAVYTIQNGGLFRTWQFLATTRAERKGLIFHTAHFQIVFLIFSFLILTSSGSLLGRGIVLGFLLHLIVDQGVDFWYSNSLQNWFSKLPITLDKNQTTYYWVANVLILLIFSVLL